jgi:PhnB protein
MLPTRAGVCGREESRMYIPPGFNTVTPYHFVRDAERFIAFLVNGLGGEEVCRTMRPDGAVANVQVRLGSSTVMVSEASVHYPAMAAAYYLYVEDADASMQRALGAGAMLEMAVADMPYGDRQGGVRDGHGNIWWISQRTMHAPYTP